MRALLSYVHVCSYAYIIVIRLSRVQVQIRGGTKSLIFHMLSLFVAKNPNQRLLLQTVVRLRYNLMGLTATF
jgi:hypothetical protein